MLTRTKLAASGLDRTRALAALWVFVQGHDAVSQASLAFPGSPVESAWAAQARSIGYLCVILGERFDPLAPQYPSLPPTLLQEASQAFADLSAATLLAKSAENESLHRVSCPFCKPQN